MAVSPDQLRALRFDEGMRGYDKRQVDKVIARVADLVEDLQGRLDEAQARAARGGGAPGSMGEPASAEGGAEPLDETLRRTLVLAQRTADAAIGEARDDAARIRSEAQAEAEVILGDARARAEELGAEADERHARSVAEAEAERSRLLSGARQRAEVRIAEVEAELAASHGAVRAELAEQITQLTHIRDLLADDIERLEGHLARRRQQVRAALDEVAAVLDDPDKLHAAETPGLEPVEEPPPADGYQAVSVKVQALEDLEGDLEAPDGVTGAGPEQPRWVGTPRSGSEPDDGAVDDGPPTELHPVVADADADADDHGHDDHDDEVGQEAGPAAGGESVDDEAGPAEDEPARPAWADSVPSADVDERPVAAVAGGDAGTEEADSGAMERFFGDHGDDDRRGWFRRRA